MSKNFIHWSTSHQRQSVKITPEKITPENITTEKITLEKITTRKNQPGKYHHGKNHPVSRKTPRACRKKSPSVSVRQHGVIRKITLNCRAIFSGVIFS